MSAAPVAPGGPLASAVAAITIALIRALPRGLRDALARALGRVAWWLRIRRRIALDNLAHAFPEKSESERARIARAAYGNMALAAIESVCSDLLSEAELERTVRAIPGTGWASMEPLLMGAGPVLIVSAHFGSWELLAEVMARRGAKFSAVVRPLAGAFNARVVASRHGSGYQLILQRGAMQGILAALKQGRAVVQLIDQSLAAKHGVFVPFFGRLASTTPSVSLAALRTGAPVFVALAAREGSDLKMSVEGPIAVPSTGDREADLLTAIIERKIREYPEQWLWLHRRWKVRPGQEAGAEPVNPTDAPGR